MSRRKNAIIFGETGFAINCIKYLLEQKWHVNVVVTRDSEVESFCQHNSIKSVSINEISQLKVALNCYLFSTINPYLISNNLLAQIKPVLALNYHDSLLPKYAGVNSTTWAILNQETVHGISWHEITSGIDEGGIVYQAQVLIDKDDTVFDLNLKCTEAGLLGFREIIKRITQNRLTSTLQDLTKKTYWGLDYISPNYSYLRRTDAINYINRILNSLSFGSNYHNPVATAKIKIKDKSYIIEKRELGHSINEINNLNCKIKNIYGKEIATAIDYNQIEDYTIDVQETNYFRKIKQSEFVTYNKLRKILNIRADDSGLLTAKLNLDKNYEFTDVAFYISLEQLSTFLAIIFKRLSSNNIFIKIYHDNGLLSNLLKSATEQISLFTIDDGYLNGSYTKLLDKISTDIAKNKFEVTKDFAYRYHLNWCSEFAIANNYFSELDAHRVVFFINKSGLSIRFWRDDSKFIGIIVKCLEVLFSTFSKLNLSKKAKLKLNKISLLSEEDYAKVIYTYNETRKAYPTNKTIQQLFEEQTVKTPNNIAVVHEDRKLTYKELNQRSNQLANYLRKNYEMKGDDLIILCLDRSEYILIAILAVLKSSVAYVPIDPSYPEERIQYIVNDTKAKVVLANEEYKEKLKMSCAVCFIDESKFQTSLKKTSSTNPKQMITSQNLAYVIYTSGTTGKPKGVMITHGNVVNVISALSALYKIQNVDGILLFANYTFDASIEQMFLAMINGAKLIVPNDEYIKDASLLAKLIKKEKITHLHITPSYLEILDHAELSNLNRLISGGDYLAKGLFEKLATHVGALINEYGPTETTITAIVSINKFGIGKPIANTTAYILDSNLNPLPIGAIGELYIGGDGVARGYLNMPDLTALKFILNPFQSKIDQKVNRNKWIYKTGDLVRMLADGNLEFIGRNDSQVKIRGYRIELGEIENRLLAYSGIKQALVLQRTEDKMGVLLGTGLRNKYLVAYYVAKSKLDEAKILQYLGNSLPEYMVPLSLLWLEKLPLTLNGKLDHNALPDPEFKDTSSEYVGPRNELENFLVTTISTLLGIEGSKLSIRADFFKLGGDSINAIQLVNRIRQQLGLKISIKEVYAYKTIENLVNNVIILAQAVANNLPALNAETGGDYDAVSKNKSYLTTSDVNYIVDQEYLDLIQKDRVVEGVYLANSLQQGLIYHYLNQGNVDDAYLEQSIFIYKSLLNLDCLEFCWNLAIAKYPSLRLRFLWDKELVQIVDKTEKIDFRVVDISLIKTPKKQKLELEKIIAKDRAERFDLRKGKLLRITLIKQTRKLYHCIVHNHHIISDGWSQTNLMDFVHSCYIDLANKSEDKDSLRFKLNEDIAYLSAQEYLQQHLNKDDNHFQNMLAAVDEYTDLSYLQIDKNVDLRKVRQTARYEENVIEIENQLYQELIVLSQNNALSLSSILQYVWHKLLNVYGNSDITISGTVVSGRNLPIDDIEKSVGLYINTLPLVITHDDKCLLEQLKQVQDQINELNERSSSNLANLQSAGSSLFESLFIYENYPLAEINKNSQVLNVDFIRTIDTLDYPLCIMVFVIDQKIIFKLRYDVALFGESIILMLLNKIELLLKQIVTISHNPGLKTLNLLDEFEYKKIIYTYNKTEKPYSEHKTIHQIFEEQVKKTPDNIALVHENSKLTYQGLNVKANQLANYLRRVYRIKGDDLILLCLNRMEYMLIGILAVLKSGAAYVPLDPSYPDERILYIEEDTKAKVILTNKVYKEKLQQIFSAVIPAKSGIHLIDCDICVIDEIKLQTELKKEVPTNPQLNITSDNLAYVIYTSGTTGKPKGVMIEHRNVVMFMLGFKEKLKVTKNQSLNMLSTTNYVFDIFALEYSLPLFYGYSIDLVNVDSFLNQSCKIKLSCYDYIQLTPSKVDLLLSQVSHERLKNQHRVRLLIGGEALSKNHIQQIRDYERKYKNIKFEIINVYGPTETTIWSTISVLNMDEINIGKPLYNETAYILDNKLNPLPIGAVGELYIGGAGLARGYLNNLALTEEKFILNPFQTSSEKAEGKNVYIYKTGDLVRMLADGNIEYIGRNDFQVKIRGYRIELSEIENILNTCRQVKQSVVLAYQKVGAVGQITEKINTYLVGYYVVDVSIKDKDLSRYVENWQDIYDSTYDTLDVKNYKENTIGWNSSYTGQEICKEEMLEWRNETINKIKKLDPQNILEIGSGSGLLLFNLLDICKYYYATDFSPHAIEYTKKVVEKIGCQDKVTAICSGAHELQFTKLENKFDLVILNSVVQYFPSIDYFENILAKIIDNITSRGKIFIGDIRDYRLLECFHYSILTHKNRKVSCEEIEYFKKREKELLISPEYFIYFQNKYPQVAFIEIMPKISNTENEMNCFRYDAVIHINKSNKICVTTDIDFKFFMPVANVDEYLNTCIDKQVYIKYPNKKNAKYYIECCELYQKNHNYNVNIRDLLHLNELLDIFTKYNYQALVYLDVIDPVYLNIIGFKGILNNVAIDYKINKVYKYATANNPAYMAKLLESQNTHEIRAYLETKLPDYMIPSYLIALDKLPLTINGKLDRMALPNPEFIDSNFEYIAPHDKLEEALVTTFSVALGIEEDKLSITRDFFSLGGNSILAIKLINQLNKELKVLKKIKLSVADIFEYKNIKDLANFIRIKSGESPQEIRKPLQPYHLLNSEDYVLSFAEERLWFIDNLKLGLNVYNMPLLLKLSKDTKTEYMLSAIIKIVTRHEVLRSIICQDVKDNPYRKVLPIDKDNFIQIYNYVNVEELNLQLKEAVKYTFKLTQEIPFKVFFFIPANGAGDTLLLILMHHIASDAWSLEILERELNLFYQYYSKFGHNSNLPEPLPKLSIQYKDYALWQREFMSGETLEEQLSYWKNELFEYENLNLTTDKPRSVIVDYAGSNEELVIDTAVSSGLRKLSGTLGISLYSVMLSAYYLLLSSYTNQTDIVVGTPIANRNYDGVDNIIGVFVNMLALRYHINKDLSIKDYLYGVWNKVVMAQKYQDLPFEKLVSALNLERDSRWSPIFQTTFNLQNISSHKKYDDQYFSYYNIDDDIYKIAKFDLSTTINDDGSKLILNMNYRTSLYAKETILGLITTYNTIITNLGNIDINKSLSNVELLSLKQKQFLIQDYNPPLKLCLENKTIYELFEEHAQKTPNNIAIVYEEIKLTYFELNEKANQLANYLRRIYKIKGDELIALCLDKSEYMPLAILAVLKSGGAYVPIDPSHPNERISYILEDTKAKVILTNEIYYERFLHILDNIPVKTGIQKEQSDVCCIDEVKLGKESATNLTQIITNQNLAYVIYTSGTTGNPKGVMIEHKNISNYISSLPKEYAIGSNERILLLANYIFDASIEQMFLALTTGNVLVITKQEIINDPNKLARLITAKQITHLHATPSYLAMIKPSEFAGLKRVISAGELLPVELYQSLKKDVPIIINKYGPTETTISVLVGKNCAHLGKPFANTAVYILDDKLRVLPIGAIGELYIGGVCLARGYLNNSDLTHAKFIKNPFLHSNEKEQAINSLLYKTGDLVRMLVDGNIDFIGRNDSQVKIRGYRVEFGEIESRFLKYPGIKQAVVVERIENQIHKTDTANKYLVGYYVSDKQIDENEIISYLGKYLPEYMLPSMVVYLEKLPLTRSGKLDRTLLPIPEFHDKAPELMETHNELEIVVCEIFAQVLGLNTIQLGTNVSFFKMGGNSLLVIKLKNRLNQLVEFKSLSVADIFKYDTVHKLVATSYAKESSNFKLHKQTQDEHQEIAIIGMSGAFSGASSIAELWQLIINQREGLRSYTLDECRSLGVDEETINNDNYIPVAGRVSDIDLFDPSFWGVSVNEAKQTDPQIRKFVEHCWFALENAGYIRKRQTINIGVFAGCGDNSYFYENILPEVELDKIDFWEAHTLNTKDALSTRTAYLLGLIGPANSINTACSTSLVTVVEACKNLLLGTCDMALAGGVSLPMPDKIGYIYQDGMIVSKDGHCRTFDENSSGTVGGAGIGVVLLKRLKDAIKDKDNIIAVIKGYASNNDGRRKSGYTAPSALGQTECILNAQQMAGIKAKQIDYIECHGTATNLGDPIEIQGLKEAFAVNNSDINLKKCYLGAVKANIGHADSAAGIAGLIKVCSMLQHSVIPGQANFSKLNPLLELAATDFIVAATNSEWKRVLGRLRVAGVSSFGIGGTNAHVVVSEYIAAELEPENNFKVDKVMGSTIGNKRYEVLETNKFIFPFSAQNRKSLDNYRQKIVEYLESKDQSWQRLDSLAYTLQNTRENFNCRLCVKAKTKEELISQLTAQTHITQIKLTEDNPRLVFMFPGQGTQYHDMAIDLYQNEIEFKLIVDEVVTLANLHLSINLLTVLYPSIYPSKASEDIRQTKWTQISLFTISYALAKYLLTIGIKADAYIGHSIGEYVAATLTGVFNLEDAVKLVILRGQIMQMMKSGGMLAINGDNKEIRDIVASCNCEIAAYNSLNSIVASGGNDEIKLLLQALEANGIIAVKLMTSHAFHSRMMDEAADLFSACFKQIILSKPQAKFISNLNGQWAADEVTKINYWCKQLRNPVEFSQGVQTITDTYLGNVLFVEIGVGKTLSGFVSTHKYNEQALNSVQILPSFKEYQNKALEVKSKTDLLGILWEHGVISELDRYVTNNTSMLLTDLPNYQFDFQSCWIKKIKHPIKTQLNNEENMFYTREWERIGYFLDLIEPGALYNNSTLVLVNDKRQQITKMITELSGLVNTHVVFNGINIDEMNNIENCSSFDFSVDENFSKLFRLFESKQQKIDCIIYFSSSLDYAKPELDIIAIKNVMDLCNANKHVVSRFISISFDNFEVLGTEKCVLTPSIVYGITKSLNTEYLTSDFKVTHFDFTCVDGVQYKLIDLLRFTNTTTDLILLRNNYAWIPKYIQVSLVNKIQNNYANGMVFLITGGLGAVGYAYSNYLSSNLHNCVLILLGSSCEETLRPDYKDRLMKLRETDNKILYLVADIGLLVFDNLISVLREHKINKIDYVLHSAGKAAKSATQKKTTSDIKEVINPKIKGFWNITKISQKIKMDTVLMCSSKASIIPSVGNLEYTAANLFLDEISYRCYKNINKIVTINFNQISDLGMAVDFRGESNLGSSRNLNSIKSIAIPIIINNIINNYSRGNVVLSKYNLSQLMQKLPEDVLTTHNNLNKIKVLEIKCSDMERQMAEIFCEVIGVDEISIYDDFFRLGGNSLLAIKLISLINKLLIGSNSVRLTLIDILKLKNIKNLANLIEKRDVTTVYNQGEI